MMNYRLMTKKLKKSKKQKKKNKKTQDSMFTRPERMDIVYKWNNENKEVTKM